MQWAISPIFYTKMLGQAMMDWLLRQDNPWMGTHLLAAEAAGGGFVMANILSLMGFVYTWEKNLPLSR